MSEPRPAFPKVNWRITATTVICETTGDEVTVMVHGDGTIKCTALGKAKQNRKSKGRSECTGPECPQNVRYREKLFSEPKG